MEVLFRDFEQAQLIGLGPLLATTITPIAPPDDPHRLQYFFRAANSFSIQSVIRDGISLHATSEIRFLKPERNAWVDVYVAYWKAIGEIIAGDTAKADWSKVYEAWKEVANVIIKGYASAGFQAWTVPCLYVAGRYLRIFAIKADEGVRGTGTVNFKAGFQDDITGESGKNEKLEDAARVINRMFTLCISDRYVVLLSVSSVGMTV